jgi:hypothetical protein
MVYIEPSMNENVHEFEVTIHDTLPPVTRLPPVPQVSSDLSLEARRMAATTSSCFNSFAISEGVLSRLSRKVRLAPASMSISAISGRDAKMAVCNGVSRQSFCGLQFPSTLASSFWKTLCLRADMCDGCVEVDLMTVCSAVLPSSGLLSKESIWFRSRCSRSLSNRPVHVST